MLQNGEILGGMYQVIGEIGKGGSGIIYLGYHLPLKEEEALEMLKSLKSFKLLNGYRGTEKCDIKALCQTIVAISNYAQANKDVLKELDINPLFVYPEGKGVGVADALIVKRK